MVNTVKDDLAIRKGLFHSAMKGEWNEVKEIYKSNRAVHKEKIIRSGSTALHIAVSDGQEAIVEQLVRIVYEAAQIESPPEIEAARNDAQNKIKDAKDKAENKIKAAKNKADRSNTEARNAETTEKIESSETEISNINKDLESKISQINKTLQTKIEALETAAFRIEDERGNTPLHTAAALGSLRMCDCITGNGKHSSLIATRNHDGETPFFLAALHGHKDAFLLLHFLCGAETGYTYSRRNDGDTILHCAISGDYFDLAYQIITLYPNLVNALNERGQSPIHLLATKPSAFRSGSHLGRFKGIIYHCIFVDELQEVPEDKIPELLKLKSTDQKNTKKGHPDNYETCCNFINLLKHMVNAVRNIVISRRSEEQGENITDTENPPRSAGKRNAVGPDDKSRNAGAQQAHQLFPRNNESIFQFVKLVSKTMLIVLGLGSNEIKKIREKKEKHTWSVQILDKILTNVSMYEYEDDGRTPEYANTFDGASISFPLDSASDQWTNIPSENGLDASKKDKDDGIKGKGSDKGDSVEKQENGQEMVKSRDTLMSNAAKNGSHDVGANPEEINNIGETQPNVQEMAENKKSILITVRNASTNIVQKIQEQLPLAIHDINTNKKVILTVESRQEDIPAEMSTPVLVAAMNGITEIVERILQQFPVAIHDVNSKKKNIVLLAVENRQPHVYNLLLQTTTMKESVFRRVDNKGNSALHLAATLGDHKPWLIPGAALQMQWELKWYQFVKNSMPFHFFARHNKEGKTPKDIFTETHQDLVKAGGEWLTNTSESCSVVAALIATVAFATSATVPGGVKEDSGTPTLENEPAFNVFAISSLVALCFSVTAVVMFLAILTSRYQEKDFAKDLPQKLLIGLTSLFVSIASMLVSFCAGHFFVLKDKLKYAAFPVYAITCLPVTFFAIAQFPLYFDLMWATFKNVPQRTYKSVVL